MSMVTKSIEQLFYKYFKKIVFLSYGVTNDYQHSEEIVSTVFVELHKTGLNNFEDEEKVKAWLSISTLNRSRNLLIEKNGKRRARLVFPEEMPQPLNDQEIEATDIYSEILVRLNEYIEQLPYKKQLLLKDWMNGIENKKIATKYNIKKDTFYSHLQQSLEFLKMKLGLPFKKSLLNKGENYITEPDIIKAKERFLDFLNINAYFMTTTELAEEAKSRFPEFKVTREIVKRKCDELDIKPLTISEYILHYVATRRPSIEEVMEKFNIGKGQAKIYIDSK